jgi:superfamily I DNA/RNA helicase
VSDSTLGIGSGSVAEKRVVSNEEAELNAAIQRVLSSSSRKKLVVAGPGTGKTTLFRKMLESASGEPDRRIVLTFINNLKNDLEEELSELAEVFTLHSYCLGLLYRDARLRGPLSPSFRCCPGLAGLIQEDWKLIQKCDPPQFVGEMRKLAEENHIPFYLARGDYYDAVDFDDTVYRVYRTLASGDAVPDTYDLVLIDEYQDFNGLEAAFIDMLAQESPIMIAGDDDQALYSQLRDSSWDHIRMLHQAGEYEVFELPFCMRCPKVVVDAVSDVIARAQQLRRLQGRIPKPYKHFPPAKGADSAKYPKIALVETTVQRQNANYMGRYIAQAIADIPRDEIEAATSGGYSPVLVIVGKPYRDQIISHLEKAGYSIDTRRESVSKLDRQQGLSILQENRDSSLGWRIVLNADRPPFIRDVITKTADGTQRLVDTLPNEFRERVLVEVDTYEPPKSEVDDERRTEEPAEQPPIRVTSFEGAKGLSAQHVFIAGLHDHELPHNPQAIQDLEICKFVVGLTRTRKKCSLIHTRNFAGTRKLPSAFISWINAVRLERIKVDAAYWRE